MKLSPPNQRSYQVQEYSNTLPTLFLPLITKLITPFAHSHSRPRYIIPSPLLYFDNTTVHLIDLHN